MGDIRDVTDIHLIWKPLWDKEVVGVWDLIGTEWEDGCLWIISGFFWLSDNETGESHSLHCSHTQEYHGGVCPKLDIVSVYYVV